MPNGENTKKRGVRAMSENKKMVVKPLSNAIGAEILGVNLAQELDEATISEIRKAFLAHQVVFFRNQDLSPEQQVKLARRFGELDVHQYVEGMPGYPEIIPIVKEADESGYNFGGIWHTDVTFEEKPSLGSLLYGVEVPPVGGDTLWANQYLAYETLSEGLKEVLDGLVGLHNASMTYGLQSKTAKGGVSYGTMNVSVSETAEEMVTHPVVRTHPETGRKGLFVNGNFTKGFQGWTTEESRPLLKFLFAHSTQERFTCRFRWETGSIAFWDNRCTQHYALNDYDGHRREMRRVSISGDRPA